MMGESGGLLHDLREMEQGYIKRLAGAQATVEALFCGVCGKRREAQLNSDERATK